MKGMCFFIKGGKPVKMVYIDPPLPKKEMTVREKNSIFHEFLADFHMTKQSSILACAAVLDKLPEDPVSSSSMFYVYNFLSFKKEFLQIIEFCKVSCIVLILCRI